MWANDYEGLRHSGRDTHNRDKVTRPTQVWCDSHIDVHVHVCDNSMSKGSTLVCLTSSVVIKVHLRFKLEGQFCGETRRKQRALMR